MKSLKTKSLDDIRLKAFQTFSTTIDLNALKGGKGSNLDNDCDGDVDE